MNLNASAIAPEFQWLWIVVGVAALGSGALVAAFGGRQKGMLATSIQGTLLSLVLLSVAPTAAQQEQRSIEELTDYAELLGAKLIEVHPESGEAYIDEPNLGLISVGLEDGYLKILTGENTGNVWYYDALLREHKIQELQQSDSEERTLEQ